MTKTKARAEVKTPARDIRFHIPLAEQFRRRFAKPQRLVRFQHGIPFSNR